MPQNEAGIRIEQPKSVPCAKGAMPVTVGVFVNPGVVPASSDGALPRFNRSVEYDDISDRYATCTDFAAAAGGLPVGNGPGRRWPSPGGPTVGWAFANRSGNWLVNL